MHDPGVSRCGVANVRLDVIASAAKQSILSLRGRMDCLAALAMTAGASGFLRGACHRARVRTTVGSQWRLQL